MDNRLVRTQMLLGEEAMEKLKNSTVAVFGSLGGVWAMIFAVPVTAVLKLNFDRFINFQKKKRRLKLTYDKKQI